MLRPTLLFILTGLLTPAVQAQEDISELRDQVSELKEMVQILQQQVSLLQASQPQSGNIDNTPVLTQSSRRTFSENTDTNTNVTVNSSFVDLSLDEAPSIDSYSDNHVLANPWWRNVEISGFAASGFYDTGSAGTRDNGSFEVREASLFIQGDVWENIGFYLEFQSNRLGKDDDVFTRTGEVYLHFRDLALFENMPIGLKVGRIDIPFGEEYLRQDAIDNPLISFSAAYPYGWDEGVLVSGAYRGLNWIAAVTDGTDDRSTDSNSDKSLNLKFHGNPTDSLYLSLSLMREGDTSKGAFEFGGSHLRPIDSTAGLSTLGHTTSFEVDGLLGGINAKYSFEVMSHDAYIALAGGAAQQNDQDDSFDRSFRWFSIEPYVNFNNNWYGVARYSEIGTYDSNEGYAFSGKTFTDGTASFGFDTERLRRLALGIGWTPNPRMRAKIEVGKDWFDLIDASPLATNNGDRLFLGLEAAVKF